MIQIKRKLLEEALDQLKAAQQDSYVQSTEMIINEIEVVLRQPAVINLVCDKCGDTGNMGNPTLSEPDGQRCDCKQTCL